MVYFRHSSTGPAISRTLSTPDLPTTTIAVCVQLRDVVSRSWKCYNTVWSGLR